MSRNQKDFTFDIATQLKDAGAVTASSAATVGGVAKILNLGASRFDGRAIVDISALTTNGAAGENYYLALQFSSSATFASDVIGGPMLHVGAAATLVAESAVSVPGRYEMPFTSEISGTTRQYARLYIVAAGTAPSINFTAIVVQEF